MAKQFTINEDISVEYASHVLEKLRVALLTGEAWDSFETCLFSSHLFLEALATIEQAERKLRFAALLAARERSRNF